MSRLNKLEQLLQDDPEDVFLNYAVAKELLSNGETSRGLEKLGEVIGRFPDYVPAYFQLGQSLEQNGQSESAREVITRGIAVAVRVGDQHAESEMRSFLELL